jgi:hypothetical protein
MAGEALMKRDGCQAVGACARTMSVLIAAKRSRSIGASHMQIKQQVFSLLET